MNMKALIIYYSQTGNTQKVARKIRDGLKTEGWDEWYGDCSIQIFPEPYYTHGHPDAADLGEAFEFGTKMGKMAKAYLRGEHIELPKTPEPEMMPMHANAAIDHLGGFHNVHGRLVRDQDKCLYPKCHICIDNCPMGYNDYKSDSPQFGDLGNCCDNRHG